MCICGRVFKGGTTPVRFNTGNQNFVPACRQHENTTRVKGLAGRKNTPHRRTVSLTGRGATPWTSRTTQARVPKSRKNQTRTPRPPDCAAVIARPGCTAPLDDGSRRDSTGQHVHGTGGKKTSAYEPQLSFSSGELTKKALLTAARCVSWLGAIYTATIMDRSDPARRCAYSYRRHRTWSTEHATHLAYR